MADTSLSAGWYGPSTTTREVKGKQKPRDCQAGPLGPRAHTCFDDLNGLCLLQSPKTIFVRPAQSLRLSGAVPWEATRMIDCSG